MAEMTPSDAGLTLFRAIIISSSLNKHQNIHSSVYINTSKVFKSVSILIPTNAESENFDHCRMYIQYDITFEKLMMFKCKGKIIIFLKYLM